MAVGDFLFWSESIGKRSNLRVVMPERIETPLPVLYLLHGLGEDYTCWTRRAGLETHLGEMKLIVVMPDGDTSWYVNDPRPGGRNYEDHIVREVVSFVDRTLPTIANPSARAVAGMSMGGYGAMMLAMRHPDVFGTVSAHSSAFFFTHIDTGRRPDVDTFADALDSGEKYDLFALAERHAESDRRLNIRFDCGMEDELIECNRSFHEQLEKLGIDHRYEEFPGNHDMSYWNEHLPRTLRWAREHLEQE